VRPGGPGVGIHDAKSLRRLRFHPAPLLASALLVSRPPHTRIHPPIAAIPTHIGERSMKSTHRWLSAAACAALAALGTAPAAQAQEAEAPQYQQVISANPLGLLLEFFNAEYERRLTPFSTAGVGGSTLSSDGDDYVNADAFWRYYPQGRALDGFAFGVKAGITSFDGDIYPGIGFDANYSWLLGKKNNFYVGTGIGLKRLIGEPDENGDFLEYVPTIRLVNIGFAF
jgi:hypothetical protein